MRALSVVFAAVVVQGCFVGRDLTYLDDAKSSAASATSPSEDAGTSKTTDDGTLPPPPPPSHPDGGTHDSGTKDASTPPPPPGDCAKGAFSEVEPNDQAVQGNPLVVGTTCGRLVVGSDVDWYQFDVDASTVTISFDADADAYIAIVGIAKSDTYTGKAGSRIQFPGDGKYYVRIYSFDTVAQAYRITREQ